MPRSLPASPFLPPRTTSRAHYVAMGRRGGLAKAARHRQTLTPEDVRRGAAESYAHALGELHAAARAAEVAYWSRDAGAIRRAIRWVTAANLRADSAWDGLVALGATDEGRRKATPSRK